MNCFSPIQVIHLPIYILDYIVIMIELEILTFPFPRKKMHLLRFEKYWVNDNRCEKIVRQFWWRGQIHYVGKIKAL